MNDSLYTRDILRLAVSIPHQQRLAEPDGTAEIRSRTCGSRVAADIQLSPAGTITEFGIEVNACALGQASAAILSREVVGKSVTEIKHAREHLAQFLAGREQNPGEWDSMDLLASARDHKGRHAAILLPYDALLSAFQNASSKSGTA